MQNLSFLKQTMASKPVEEVNKNLAVSNNKPSQNFDTQNDFSGQNTFQSVFNKQIQAKRALESQAAKSNAKPNTQPPQNREATAEKNTIEDGAREEVKAETDTQTNVAQVASLIDLAAQIKEKMLGDASADKDESQQAVVEDAAMLANLMQEVAKINPQAVVDPAMLKTHLQSAHDNATEAGVGDGVEVASNLPNQSFLTKEFNPNALDNHGLSNASVKAEPNSDNSALQWKNVVDSASAGHVADRDLSASLQAASGDAQTSFNQARLDADALKFTEKFSDKLGQLKESAQEINTAATQQALASTPINQQALASTQAANNYQINTYPGRAGWNQEVSQKVVWMVGNGEQSATLTLNPPDLGPVQVVIHVHNDQADATFISDNPVVRQALEDGLEHLRESMESSGLSLGQTNINAGQQSQQGFKELAQKQFANQLKSQQLMGASEPMTQVLTRESNGLVDTFA